MDQFAAGAKTKLFRNLRKQCCQNQWVPQRNQFLFTENPSGSD
jgi:hypothetical protein